MRLTEILCSAQAEKMPNNEQIFHLDIADPKTRADIIELRKQSKKEKTLFD